MKKFVLIIAVMIAMCQMAMAQQIRESFVNMPDSLSALLTKVNREDFIDFLDSNMKAEVNNRLGGKTEMTRLTDDFLEVKMSGQSTFQLKVLKTGDAQVLCAVSTVCGPACDSHIRFYTPGWQELDASAYLPRLPEISDFLKPLPEDAAYELRDAFRKADMLLMKAELSPDNSSLTFTFTTPEYMSSDAAKLLEPYIIPSVTKHWNGRQFE